MMPFLHQTLAAVTFNDDECIEGHAMSWTMSGKAGISLKKVGGGSLKQLKTPSNIVEIGGKK